MRTPEADNLFADCGTATVSALGRGCGSFYESAYYAPRLEEVMAKEELHFTRDITPAGRVKEVFARFVLNEAKRGRHYSSLATAIR